MTYQDIITNKQKLVEVFEDNNVEGVLDDDNHRYLLHYLNKGPLTVEELRIAFVKSGNEKSDKTIYRYLNKLKKAGLVIEAGKRIFMDEENQIKTQTLFARVAKIIFTPYNKMERNPELKRKSLNILNNVLKERLKINTDAKLDCLDT
ncbi:MAG: ArsR family transcriptional regulator, partial [Candidatus Thorarchaeota archaeon]